MTPLEVPGAPKMEAKITPGAAQDAEKWSKNFSGGSPAGTSEFVFALGGLQERSAVDFYYVLGATWGPGAPRGSPGGSPEASGSSFWLILGAVLGPPGHHFQRSALICSFSFRLRSSLFSPAPSALLVAFSLLQSLRPPLGGRFWGACPYEIRPPSIT